MSNELQETLRDGISDWFAAYPASDMRLSDNIDELAEALHRHMYTGRFRMIVESLLDEMSLREVKDYVIHRERRETE